MAAVCGLVPSIAISSSPKVIWAMIGRSASERASAMPSSSSCQFAERLEQQQIDAALEQALDLLAEGGPDLGV